MKQTGNRISILRSVSTIIILVLILGYIPFTGLLFNDMEIFYLMHDIREYDGVDHRREPVSEVDIYYLDAENSFLIEGLVIKKKFAELIFDTQGMPVVSAYMDGEIIGEPEQFWYAVNNMGGDEISSGPLFISFLEDETWNIIEEGNLSLYQKDNAFESIKEFCEFVASSNENIYVSDISGGEVLTKSLSGRRGPVREMLKMPIRGRHSAAFIVDDNRILFDFRKQDLNRYIGSDEVSISIYKDDSLIKKTIIPDDGNTSDDFAISRKPIFERIELNGVENGLYRMEIGSEQDGNDYVIASIRTTAKLFSFTRRVFLFDPLETMTTSPEIKYDYLDIYMTSPSGILSARTWHPWVPRSIKSDEEPLILLRPSYESPELELATDVGEGNMELSLENPGSLILDIQGGSFSFIESSLFDAYFRNIHSIKDIELETHDYVLIRNYETPSFKNGFLNFSRNIVFDPAEPFKGKYRLCFEVHGKNVVLSELTLKHEKQ